jgi:hypothetical protein
MSDFLSRRRPSPAMAVAFVALLAALSGTAIALPGKNTVDSGDIKKGAVKRSDIGRNAVTGSKIKNGAVGSRDARNNSLTGTDINESTLGEVPSANTANTANSAGNADTTDGRSLGCPSGTREYAGACIEETIRGQATWAAASKTCGDAGRRLPTTSELEGFRQLTGITVSPTTGSEMSATVTDDNTNEFMVTINDAGAIFGIARTSPRDFRCATSLVQ